MLLLEQGDFGKGTSSRSTKLVHGGVRYLEQGNISLVMEALKERGLLRQNAPHLVGNLPFVVPSYDWWEAPFYGLGLKIYNLLAGKYGFGQSSILSREETLERLPTIRTEGLRGGVVYYDGQFDDARLLINLMQTAVERGAVALNYLQVGALTKRGDGTVGGVVARDLETGRELTAHGNVIINATGPFSDSVRRLADPDARALIAPSQGIHLVFDRSFLPGDSAIMVPHTRDGRVMFAIPWHDHTVVGTTDTPIPEPALDGWEPLTTPLLPNTPAAEEDTVGHLLIRALMEDIAMSEADFPKSARLEVLSELDQLPVAYRASLGRHLTDQLGAVSRAPTGSVAWAFRLCRFTPPQPQLLFGVCNQSTELTREEWSRRPRGKRYVDNVMRLTAALQ